MSGVRSGTLAVVVFCSLAGCAKSPETIGAAPIAGAPYAAYSCEQITAALKESETALAVLSESQSRKRAGDAMGVILIGVPVASAVGEDHEVEIAMKKGQINALKAERQRKSCI